MPATPEIFPKTISFYQSPAFTGIRHLPVDLGYDVRRTTIVAADERQKRRMFSQLTCQRFSHLGRLSGEYAILRWALLAIDRDGTPIRINSAPDDDWAHDSWFHQLETYCCSDQFMADRDRLLAEWDNLQLAHNAYVLSEVHAFRNYYHFTVGLLPKIRRSPNASDTLLCMPSDFLQRPFQRELLMKTGGHRGLSLYEQFVRVRDPHVLQEPFSREAADWLRATTGLQAAAGKRRVYITRKSTIVGREHGTINETDAFKRILADYNFETIDFGAGEVPVEEQVRRLQGAGLVLSAHGANLTNILYLRGEASVVELLPYYWTQPSYMQIAALSDLRYFGIVSPVDAELRLAIDPDALRGVLNEAIA